MGLISGSDIRLMGVEWSYAREQRALECLTTGNILFPPAVCVQEIQKTVWEEISTHIEGLKSNEQFIQFWWQVGFRVSWKEFIAIFNHKVNRDLSFNIYVLQKKKKQSTDAAWLWMVPPS